MSGGAVDPVEVARRVAEVRDRIASAGGATTGPSAVRLVAVTKTFGPDAIRAAVEAGCDAVGENYAQELLTKWTALTAGGVEPFRLPEVHFIGRLQSNKVRSLVGVVNVWQTVDRVSVVSELGRRAAGARVLVQVNATGESDKGGVPIEDARDLVAAATDAGLVVEGLMTVGPTDGGPEDARRPFALTRALCDDLGLAVCSMGMTHDLEVAVQEGATMVRIGTALFGSRPSRPG